MSRSVKKGPYVEERLMKRMGRTEGRRSSYKKAYVQLTDESKSIEFFESLA